MRTWISAEMANPQNVELEAAKFLHKLIQESKDEPSKLATKLYVVSQNSPVSALYWLFSLLVLTPMHTYVINMYVICGLNRYCST